MTPDRRPDRPRMIRLGDQGATACAATAVGVPVQGPIDPNRSVVIDPRPDGRGRWRQTLDPNAPNGDRAGIRPPSTPIAQAAGGAV